MWKQNADYLPDGTNMWEGSGAYFEQTFTSGTSYKLGIVNVAVDTFFKFSIDNHTMTVVAMDFVPIEPFNTTILNIAIGMICSPSHLKLF